MDAIEGEDDVNMEEVVGRRLWADDGAVSDELGVGWSQQSACDRPSPFVDGSEGQIPGIGSSVRRRAWIDTLGLSVFLV